jgi:hypothetical protein
VYGIEDDAIGTMTGAKLADVANDAVPINGPTNDPVIRVTLPDDIIPLRATNSFAIY